MMSDCSNLFAAMHAQDFPVQAVLRGQSAISYEKDSVAVLDGPETLQKVFACNAMARRAGITAGMTKIQAEAAPNVKLGKRVKEKEDSASSALMDCGYSVSPRVEASFPGTVVVDLTGTQRLLGLPQHISEILIERALGCGLKVNVSVAANPDAALCAARGFSGITVIKPGTEARRLAELPVTVIPLKQEIGCALEDWGIRDFKSLGRLPILPLTQRMGKTGLYLQQLARGEIKRALIPCEPVAKFEESIELEESLELLEPLMLVLDTLLRPLIARLEMRALATDCIQVRFELEVHADRQIQSEQAFGAGRSSYQRTLKMPVPTQDMRSLLKLLELDIAEHPPGAPIKKVMMEALPARIRTAQSGLFERRAPEPANLEVTMAKLRAVVGERDEFGRHRVGFLVAIDSNRPDSFDIVPTLSEIPQLSRAQEHKYDTDNRLAMRVFRPSLQAKVELVKNIPSAVIFEGTRKPVTNVSGPWRKSGGWWNQAEEWKLDEWDVELDTGGEGIGLYRIFRDRGSGEWFVYGMYG